MSGKIPKHERRWWHWFGAVSMYVAIRNAGGTRIQAIRTVWQFV